MEQMLLSSSKEAAIIWPLLTIEGLCLDLGQGVLGRSSRCGCGTGCRPRRHGSFRRWATTWFHPLAQMLASAAKIPADHHVWISGNHITCLIELPKVVGIICDQVEAAKDNASP